MSEHGRATTTRCSGSPGTPTPNAIKKATARRPCRPPRSHQGSRGGGEVQEIAEAYQVSRHGEAPLYDRYGHAGVQQAQAGPPGAGAGGSSPRRISSRPSRRGRRGRRLRGLLRRGRGRLPAPEGGPPRHPAGVSFEEMPGCGAHDPGPPRDRCATCHGTGRRRARSPSPASAAAARGRSSAPGLLRAPTTGPAAGGGGTVVKGRLRRVPRRGPVQKEHEITIRVPAGIEDGTRLRVSGEARPARGRGLRGPLSWRSTVRPTAFVEREGPDILCRCPSPFARAALGGEVEVPTLSGRNPAHHPHGPPRARCPHAGLGIPDRGAGRAGDMLVGWWSRCRGSCRSAERELIEQLDRVQEENPGEARKCSWTRSRVSSTGTDRRWPSGRSRRARTRRGGGFRRPGALLPEATGVDPGVSLLGPEEIRAVFAKGRGAGRPPGAAAAGAGRPRQLPPSRAAERGGRRRTRRPRARPGARRHRLLPPGRGRRGAVEGLRRPARRGETWCCGSWSGAWPTSGHEDRGDGAGARPLLPAGDPDGGDGRPPAHDGAAGVRPRVAAAGIA